MNPPEGTVTTQPIMEVETALVNQQVVPLGLGQETLVPHRCLTFQGKIKIHMEKDSSATLGSGSCSGVFCPLLSHLCLPACQIQPIASCPVLMFSNSSAYSRYDFCF